MMPVEEVPSAVTTVAFFYDIVCPYAYIASTRVHAVCSRHGGRVAPRPILLGGVYQAVGTPSLPQRQMPAAKAAWLARDIALCAEMYGVPLRFPAGHPRRSVEAMRLILAAPEATRWPLTEAIYSAYWAEGRDIADTAVLADVARSVGLDGDALVEIIATPAAKEALRALGYRAGPIVVAILVEGLLIALVGGTAGGLAAWAAFDGYRAATLNWQSFAQVAFAFDVTPVLLVRGILMASVIGLAGGLLPAIRAARLPVATGLRAL